MNSNQLTDFHNFSTERIIFSKPEVGNIPGSKLTFKRIRMAVKNMDGTVGDLILATPPNLMCYGLQETTDQSSGKVNGYQFPMVLWNRNQPTADEKLFTEVIHNIADACKNHLVAHRDEIEKYDLEMTDLKKFNPLYYKMEKGKIVEGRGPMLYIKTLASKKDEGIRVNTVFTDEDTHQVIEPFDLLNKRCYVQGAIKIESIFIGTKISLQTKLYEARVKIIDTAFRSLLSPGVVIQKTEQKKDEEEEEVVGSLLTDTVKEAIQHTNPEPLPVLPVSTTNDETGSLQDESSDEESDDEDEDEDVPPPPPPQEEKKPVAATRKPPARAVKK